LLCCKTDAEKEEAIETDAMLSQALQHIRTAHGNAVSQLPEAVVQALAVALARRTAALIASDSNTDSSADDTEIQLAELIQTATATATAASVGDSGIAQLATALQQFAEPTADASRTEAVVDDAEEIDWGDSDSDDYDEIDTSVSNDAATGADTAADDEQAAETSSSSSSSSTELLEHLLQLEHTTTRAQEARAQLKEAEVSLLPKYITITTITGNMYCVCSQSQMRIHTTALDGIHEPL
jgi:hypothetical protein